MCISGVYVYGLRFVGPRKKKKKRKKKEEVWVVSSVLWGLQTTGGTVND